MTTKDESENLNPSEAEIVQMLHSLVAKRLIEVLNNPELITPQWIAQARGFLADNHVSGLDAPGTPLNAVKSELAKTLPFKLG